MSKMIGKAVVTALMLAGVTTPDGARGETAVPLREAAIPIELAEEYVGTFRGWVDENWNVRVAFEEWPPPGEPVTVVLDVSHFPERTFFWISGASDWEIGEQRLEPREGLLQFTATAPGEVAIDPGRIEPPLEFLLALEADGVRFPPQKLRSVPDQINLLELQLAAGNGELSLPGLWRFRTAAEGEGTNQGWHGAPFDDDYLEVSVVRPWAAYLGEDFLGEGWYQAKFEYVGNGGEQVWLELGNADESVWVYLNGHLVGAQQFDVSVDPDAWQRPRRFNLTPYLGEGENLLVCRVRAQVGQGGLYQGAALKALPADLLENPALSKRDEHWVIKGDRDHASTWRPGRYVEEWTMEIDLAPGETFLLTQEVELPQGEYHARLRYRLLGGSPEQFIFGLRGSEDWKATAETVLEPTGDWTRAEVMTPGEGPTEVAVFLQGPGRWWIDEINLVAVEAQDD